MQGVMKLRGLECMRMASTRRLAVVVLFMVACAATVTHGQSHFGAAGTFVSPIPPGLSAGLQQYAAAAESIGIATPALESWPDGSLTLGGVEVLGLQNPGANWLAEVSPDGAQIAFDVYTFSILPDDNALDSGIPWTGQFVSLLVNYIGLAIHEFFHAQSLQLVSPWWNGLTEPQRNDILICLFMEDPKATKWACEEQSAYAQEANAVCQAAGSVGGNEFIPPVTRVLLKVAFCQLFDQALAECHNHEAQCAQLQECAIATLGGLPLSLPPPIACPAPCTHCQS